MTPNKRVGIWMALIKRFVENNKKTKNYDIDYDQCEIQR